MNLMICSQPTISYKAAPQLQISNQDLVSIPSKHTLKPSSTSVCLQTDFLGSEKYSTIVQKPPETTLTFPAVLDDYGTAAYHKREAERQENVRKTLEMVDKALSFYN